MLHLQLLQSHISSIADLISFQTGTLMFQVDSGIRY